MKHQNRDSFRKVFERGNDWEVNEIKTLCNR